jgi:hypothetical protein
VSFGCPASSWLPVSEKLASKRCDEPLSSPPAFSGLSTLESPSALQALPIAQTARTIHPDLTARIAFSS